MTTQANRAGVLRLWLLNFVGNAAALAAWYVWLLVGARGHLHHRFGGMVARRNIRLFQAG